MSIVFDKVTFGYGDTPLLREVSFTLPETGTVALSGPSGCGKTTILRLLMGLEKPQSGAIRGVDGTKLAAVFQEDRLLPWRRVRDNVALFCKDRAAAEQALAAVELQDWADAYPSELSGGMARRVAIARALAMQPQLLILDEPFNGLDAALRTRIAQHLAADADNRLTLLVTHEQQDRELLAPHILSLPSPLTGTLTIQK